MPKGIFLPLTLPLVSWNLLMDSPFKLKCSLTPEKLCSSMETETIIGPCFTVDNKYRKDRHRTKELNESNHHQPPKQASICYF